MGEEKVRPKKKAKRSHEQRGGERKKVDKGKSKAKDHEAAAVSNGHAKSGDASGDFYAQVNPHKPSAFLSQTKRKGKGRRYTISIALPGSIVLNAQSPELRSRLVGHIARAAAIFNVDEIVIFREGRHAREAAAREASSSGGAGYGKGRYSKSASSYDDAGDGREEETFDEDAFIARVLQYLETPQYLRKALFPMHPDLRLAGLLPPLDLPHHLRREDAATYREGVISPPVSHRGSNPKKSWNVDVGLWDPVTVQAEQAGADLEEGIRVTVEMPKDGSNQAALVSPRIPVEKDGTYWGYSVQLYDSISEALSSKSWISPKDGSSEGYDLVIGTSERGRSIGEILASDGPKGDGDGGIPPFQHALIVFGGLSGLEVAIEHDRNIPLSAGQAHEIFDLWVNIAENQGSRTIRTEEAVYIALARLCPALVSKASASPY